MSKMELLDGSTGSKKLDNERRLNEEIQFGVGFRRTRKQERQVVIATLGDRPSDDTVHHVTTNKRHLSKTRSAVPACRTLSGRTVTSRKGLSHKEYIEILAKPKLLICDLEREHRKRQTKPCPPRFVQLAIPKKKRVFSNWQDYQEYLEPENIMCLKDLLTKKECLVPKDAKHYFTKLDAKKNRLMRIKKAKKAKAVAAKKPPRSKLVKEIDYLAEAIVLFFSEKTLANVKHRHMLVTEHIIKKLVLNKLVRAYKRSDIKNVCAQTIYEVIDQLSVWLEANMDIDDIGSDDEKSDYESSSSSESTFSGEMGEQEEPVTGIGKGFGEEELEYEMARVGDQMEADLRLRKTPSPAATIALEDYSKISEMAEDGMGEDLIDVMDHFAVQDFVAEEEVDYMAMTQAMEAEIVAEAEMEIGEQVYPLRWEEAEEVPAADTEEIYQMQRDILDMLLDEFLITEMAELEPYEEPVEAVVDDGTGRKPPDHVEEHAPDAICCLTLKTWATWLVDVAQNTHGWCQWIQDVIAQIRLFAAILRGEVKTEDGKCRRLYKEEWLHFKEQLEKDIIAWRQYNYHVKNLSDSIIAEFQNKRVICCPACLDAKMIINEESAHQVTEQLVEAIKTTGYWRRWLDDVVVEAHKLSALQLELPTAPRQPRGSISPMTSYNTFDIIEIQPTTSKDSSDASMFILEEIDKSENQSKDNINQ